MYVKTTRIGTRSKTFDKQIFPIKSHGSNGTLLIGKLRLFSHAYADVTFYMIHMRTQLQITMKMDWNNLILLTIVGVVAFTSTQALQWNMFCSNEWSTQFISAKSVLAFGVLDDTFFLGLIKLLNKE